MVHVWLSAEPDTELGRFMGELQSSTFDKLEELLHYIKQPGLEDIEYPGSDGKKRKLPSEDVKKLLCVNSYVIHLHNEHGPDIPWCLKIDPFDIRTADNRDFHRFFLDFDEGKWTTVDKTHRWMVWSYKHQNTGPGSHTGPHAFTPSPKTQKLKPSVNDYDEFTRGENFDAWNRSVTAMAGAHDIDKVLDSSLTPAPGTKEEDQYKIDNKFFYAMLCQKVKTAAGMRIIKNTPDRNGQLAYKRIVDHYTLSQEGKNRREVLKNLINTAKLPLNHNGKCNDLLLKFIAWMDEYNELSPPGEEFNDGTMLSNMETYVSTEPEFEKVEESLEDIYNLGSKPIEEKLNFYTRKALQLDKRYNRNKKLPAAKRGATLAHVTEIDEILGEPAQYDVNYHAENSITDDNDTFVVNVNEHSIQEVLEAYATRQQARPFREKKPGTMLATDVWRSLSPNGRKIWMLFQDDDRIAIVNNQKKPDASNHPSPGPGRTPPPRRAINEHSVSFEDQDANDDSAGTTLQMNHALFDSPSEDDHKTMTIMSAMRSPLTRDELNAVAARREPNDILRILSPTNDVNPNISQDQEQDQNGWDYGGGCAGENTDGKQEENFADDKKPETKKKSSKVSQLFQKPLFQRAMVSGRSPHNKNSISAVASDPSPPSYSVSMIRIDTDNNETERAPADGEQHGEHDADEDGEQNEQGQDHQEQEDVGWGRYRTPFEDLEDDESEVDGPRAYTIRVPDAHEDDESEVDGPGTFQSGYYSEHAYGINEPDAHDVQVEDDDAYAHDEGQDVIAVEYYSDESSGIYGADNELYQMTRVSDVSDEHLTESERLADMLRMNQWGVHVHRAIVSLPRAGPNENIPPPFDVTQHPDSALLDSGTAQRAASLGTNGWRSCLKKPGLMY